MFGATSLSVITYLSCVLVGDGVGLAPFKHLKEKYASRDWRTFPVVMGSKPSIRGKIFTIHNRRLSLMYPPATMRPRTPREVKARSYTSTVIKKNSRNTIVRVMSITSSQSLASGGPVTWPLLIAKKIAWKAGGLFAAPIPSNRSGSNGTSYPLRSAGHLSKRNESENYLSACRSGDHAFESVCSPAVRGICCGRYPSRVGRSHVNVR